MELYVNHLINMIRYYKSKMMTSPDPMYEEIYESRLKELETIENQNPQLIRKDSPSLLVGETLNFCDIKSHLSPMLSLEHTYNFNEASKKIAHMLTLDPCLMIQEKVDGIAVSLQYFNGFLDAAVLRGNGKFGENIINLINFVNSIPKKISHAHSTVDIRGELYLLKKNQSPEHIRSKLAGVLRRKECKDYGIYFVAYDTSIYNDHISNIDFLKKNSFKVTSQNIITSVDEFEILYNKYAETKYEYEVDGVVVKLNNKLYEYTSRYTKGMLAIKYNRAAYRAVVNNITWTMGRQNQLVPTIHIDPIIIDDMTINKVSGHNYLFIKNKNINIGTEISVSRVGNTAPQIINILKSTSYYILEKCPFCNTNVEVSSINLICINNQCSAKQIAKYHHFLKSFNITGLGDKLIDRISQQYNYEYLHIFAGLLSGTWINCKSDYTVFDIIKKYEFTKQKFIISMGWPNIGKSTISKYFINDQIVHTTSTSKTYQNFKTHYIQNLSLINQLYEISQNSLHIAIHN